MRAFLLFLLLLLAGNSVWQHQAYLRQTKQLDAAERRAELLMEHWLSAGRKVNRQAITIGELRQQITALQER
jgi:TolA-binding protein